ncbi:hypothetical protein ACFKAS_004749, partial [Salmonella enterica]
LVSAVSYTQLPWNNEKVRCLIAPEKTRRKAGFFVYRSADYDDLQRISRGSFADTSKLFPG